MSEFEEILIHLQQEVITTNFWLDILSTLLKVLAVLVITKYVLRVITYLIDSFFASRNENNRYTKQRNITLQNVAKSASRYLIYFISATIILDILGIPTTSILAGAGVIGLALGFGAQSLVKDVITGFFILFENQFTVGDYIETAGIDGIVEDVGLRITKIKNFDGDLHIIPNGNIDQVTNFTANVSRSVIDAAIDYDQNIQEATEVLEDLCSEIAEEHSDIIQEGPKVVGVQELAASSVNIRIITMVEAMELWRLNRVIRQRIKERFDQAGIDIPYEHLTVTNK